MIKVTKPTKKQLANWQSAEEPELPIDNEIL